MIDDIYDVYYRLSRPEHVFGIQQLVDVKLEENKGSESERYKRALELVIQSLIRVLEWRESEIQASAALAATLGWPTSTLAVKHPVETGVRILLGDESPKFGLGRSIPVYLSHPITVPREHSRKTGKWPEFVNEFDAFVFAVRSEGEMDVNVVPVMPTAIDEFRFARDGERLLPGLAPRWPLPRKENGETDDLLFVAAEGFESYEAYENECLNEIFNPPLDKDGKKIGLPHSNDLMRGVLMGDSEISGMLRTLKSVISLQMANRDHLLVRQCPGFLLYRPTYEEPRFTGGVRAEIRDQHTLRRFEEGVVNYDRPLLFVHDRNDMKRMFTTSSSSSPSQFVVNGINKLRASAAELIKGREDEEIGMVSPELMGTTLDCLGITDEALTNLHSVLFPAVGGSIGHVVPPSLDATKDRLVEVCLEARVRALCCTAPSTGWSWRYIGVDEKGTVVLDTQSTTKEYPTPVILGLVVEQLGTDKSQREIAAKFARAHFAALVKE